MENVVKFPSPARCRHLSVPDDVYTEIDGEWRPARGYICKWAVKSFAVTPEWFERLNGGGHLVVDPQTTCAGCPCFERLEQPVDPVFVEKAVAGAIASYRDDDVIRNPAFDRGAID